MIRKYTALFDKHGAEEIKREQIFQADLGLPADNSSIGD
jgi:hypothetical protein